MSTTLQTMSIIVINLQDNRAVFRIFITLLKFLFDSPSWKLVHFYETTRRHSQEDRIFTVKSNFTNHCSLTRVIYVSPGFWELKMETVVNSDKSGKYLPEYTVSHSWRWYSSYCHRNLTRHMLHLMWLLCHDKQHSVKCFSLLLVPVCTHYTDIANEAQFFFRER
jgi:hypothetical protein